MAHLVDRMAYTNAVPWHGLGTRVEAGRSLADWREAAGLTWYAQEVPILFEFNGGIKAFPDRKALVRSDNGFGLGIASSRYQPVQPEQIVQFYEDLCEKYGYAMETLGALKEGRIVWALAKTGAETNLAGDKIDGYLLLSTSYDGTAATTARFTGVRVVCNNTLTMAVNERARYISIPHSTTFDADKVKVELGIGEAFERFTERAKRMANREVTPEQGVEFFLNVYRGLTVKQVAAMDDKDRRTVDRELERMAGILHEAPGASMASAKGTVWGLLQAVSYDVDHSSRARTDDSRLNSAWFGAGENRKQKAFEAALELAEAA